MTRMDRAIAALALGLGMRLARPGKVPVLAALVAAWPRLDLRQKLPLPVFPDRRAAPDWMVRGETLAREQSCRAVPDTPVTSRPISPMTGRAMSGPIPGISHSRWTAGRQAPPPAAVPLSPAGPLAGT